MRGRETRGPSGESVARMKSTIIIKNRTGMIPVGPIAITEVVQNHGMTTMVLTNHHVEKTVLDTRCFKIRFEIG